MEQKLEKGSCRLGRQLLLVSLLGRYIWSPWTCGGGIVATVERLQLAVGGGAMPCLVVVTPRVEAWGWDACVPVGKQRWTMVHGGPGHL